MLYPFDICEAPVVPFQNGVSLNSKNGAAPQLPDGQRKEYESLKLGIAQDVKTGLQAFQQAGEKLLKIRQDRLYREEFDTYEGFSHDVLGHSKTYSNNLIAAFEVVQSLVTEGRQSCRITSGSHANWRSIAKAIAN
jgi:hypothetical protein